MQILKNLKHIFFIIVLALTLLFGGVLLLGRDFLFPINGYFIYRTGDVTEYHGEEEKTHTIWQDNIYRHTLTPSENIVLVTIDDASINALQVRHNGSMLTIAKSVYDEWVKILEDFWVRAIGFDIVFQNPDTTQEAFVDTLKKYGRAVIATSNPHAEAMKCVEFADGVQSCTETPLSVYADIPWWLIKHEPESRESGYDPSTNPHLSWLYAHKKLTPQDAWVHTLPLALAAKSSLPHLQPWLQNTTKRNILNPYFGGANSYKTVSFISLLRNADNDQMRRIFSGSYVLIGESGTLIHDSTYNPVDNSYMAGVESHAHFLDGLLQDKMLKRMNEGIYFFLIVFITIMSVMIFYFLPKYFSPLLVVLMFIADVWIARYAYDTMRIVIDIFPLFLASWLLTYPLTYMYRFFVTDRERRFILSTFSRYLSPEVVRRINTDKMSVRLGGEKKELSVLFSDIEGFTTISERLDPKELFQFVTTYLNQMTRVLTANGGTLDKYIGDAVMGFFGAPVDDPNHAINACFTAIEMRKHLDRINTEIEKMGLGPINFRVGIATGEVMVGNIGSEERFSYTVLGDTVNLASRLEAIGKEYGVHAVISADTRRAIGGQCIVRELDYIAVKGKNEAVRIFELIDRADAGIDTAVYEAYEVALKVYRDGRYLEAGQIWERYMEIDPPARVMAYRCLALLRGETVLDHGVYRMGHK